MFSTTLLVLETIILRKMFPKIFGENDSIYETEYHYFVGAKYSFSRCPTVKSDEKVAEYHK